MAKLSKKTRITLAAAGVAISAIAYFFGARLLYGSLAGLKQSDQLILYSIDGTDHYPGQPPQTTQKFHDFPVLGEIDIAEPERRARILSLVKSGLARSWMFTSQKKCFWPRHGVRVVSKGKTIDLVICFQCRQMHVYSDNGKAYETISNWPETELNRILQDAGIALPPPAE